MKKLKIEKRELQIGDIYYLRGSNTKVEIVAVGSKYSQCKILQATMHSKYVNYMGLKDIFPFPNKILWKKRSRQLNAEYLECLDCGSHRIKKCENNRSQI